MSSSDEDIYNETLRAIQSRTVCLKVSSDGTASARSTAQ